MMFKKLKRSTKQRRVILEELQKLTSHPTAGSLYELVRKRLPNISLGTVYRNLELLTHNRVIQKLDLTGTQARFDGNPARHNHVRCIKCGRVDDLGDLPVDIIETRFETADGYEVFDYRLEFVGLCPTCRVEGRAENKSNQGA